MRTETPALKDARTLDQQALAAIYEEHSPALFRYAVRLLGDSDLAEDCVAETFSRFLRMIKNGEGPPQHVKAYLYRMARNWITDQYRGQPPPLALDSEVTDTGVERNHPASNNGLSDIEVSESLANPAHVVAKQMVRERVRTALLQLTEEQREVIVLRFLEGWPHEQIADSLEKSVEATRALQARALAALRRMLVEPEDEESDEPGKLP